MIVLSASDNGFFHSFYATWERLGRNPYGLNTVAVTKTERRFPIMSTQPSLPMQPPEVISAPSDEPGNNGINVYDADANQIIESYRVVGKKRYKGRHTFGAIEDAIQLEKFNR